MTKPRRPSNRLVRVALVTGANHGIGLEVRRQLATRGFAVLLRARDADKARSAANRLGSIGQVEHLVLDVADATSIKNAENEVATKYRHLDVPREQRRNQLRHWGDSSGRRHKRHGNADDHNELDRPSRVCQAFLPMLRKSRASRNREVSSESGSLAQNGRGSACVGFTFDSQRAHQSPAVYADVRVRSPIRGTI